MITAVSLNPSIDRTLSVDQLVPGGLNRVRSQTDAAAGKGMNVALAAAALGERAECVGFMYRDGGALFQDRLTRAGASGDFIWCEGAVRVNVKVLDHEKGEVTEFNQSGTPVTPARLDEMTALTLRHAQSSDCLVLTGSLPPDCPVDYYRRLAEAVREAGCRVALDADGERLREGLKARPFLIKPNRYELELLTGEKLDTTQRVLGAARECARAGVSVVAVSLGGEGALITDGREAWRAPAMAIELKSTVAAGDSMIAGLCAGFSRGLDLEPAFRLGVAAATARCMTPPELIIRARDCEALAAKLLTEKLN